MQDRVFGKTAHEDMMKIVTTDNFDRDNWPERLVASNIENRVEAGHMLDILKDKMTTYESALWYKLVEDDYVLVGHIEDDDNNRYVDSYGEAWVR